MKSRIIFICAMLAFNIAYSQEDIDAPRPTNSILTGLNIGRLYDTNVQLGTKSHGGHHIILFNSYISNSQSSGNLLVTGNTKFANSYSNYGSGAGAISFIGNGGVLGFYISDVSTGEDTDITWGIPKMSILRNGNVGIGETNPSKKLVVNGVIGATEVKVSTTPNSDYVFEPDYNLKSLQEVESFIQQNKHLPDIPSAEEFKENGVGLGEMDDMLLRKVEELTLYVIEQNKKIDKLQKENEVLKSNTFRKDQLEEIIIELLESKTW